jgi:hypothetical protein
MGMLEEDKAHKRGPVMEALLQFMRSGRFGGEGGFVA